MWLSNVCHTALFTSSSSYWLIKLATRIIFVIISLYFFVFFMCLVPFLSACRFRSLLSTSNPFFSHVPSPTTQLRRQNSYPNFPGIHKTAPVFCELSMKRAPKRHFTISSRFKWQFAVRLFYDILYPFFFLVARTAYCFSLVGNVI